MPDRTPKFLLPVNTTKTDTIYTTDPAKFKDKKNVVALPVLPSTVNRTLEETPKKIKYPGLVGDWSSTATMS